MRDECFSERKPGLRTLSKRNNCLGVLTISLQAMLDVCKKWGTISAWFALDDSHIGREALRSPPESGPVA